MSISAVASAYILFLAIKLLVVTSVTKLIDKFGSDSFSFVKIVNIFLLSDVGKSIISYSGLFIILITVLVYDFSFGLPSTSAVNANLTIDVITILEFLIFLFIYIFSVVKLKDKQKVSEKDKKNNPKINKIYVLTSFVSLFLFFGVALSFPEWLPLAFKDIKQADSSLLGLAIIVTFFWMLQLLITYIISAVVTLLPKLTKNTISTKKLFNLGLLVLSLFWSTLFLQSFFDQILNKFVDWNRAYSVNLIIFWFFALSVYYLYYLIYFIEKN
jgi:hypothetical protein